MIVLENTRKYPLETVLWKLKPEGIPEASAKLAKIANEFAAMGFDVKGFLDRADRFR